MIPMNLSNITVLKIKYADYRCIISGISKREAINLLQNIDLIEKKQDIIKKLNIRSNLKL